MLLRVFKTRPELGIVFCDTPATAGAPPDPGQIHHASPLCCICGLRALPLLPLLLGGAPWLLPDLLPSTFTSSSHFASASSGNSSASSCLHQRPSCRHSGHRRGWEDEGASERAREGGRERARESRLLVNPGPEFPHTVLNCTFLLNIN